MDRAMMLSETQALKFVQGSAVCGKPSSSVSKIGPDHEFYQMVQPLLDESLLHAQHSFRLEGLELLFVETSRSTTFQTHLMYKANPNTYLLFHGTKDSNHDSIMDNGFSEKYQGQTDKGYFGKGVYLSPQVEYAASYIKETAQISYLDYKNPVKVGGTFKILGCVVITGTSFHLDQTLYGVDIPQGIDSYWAFVDYRGQPTKTSSGALAVEHSVRDTYCVLPRFRLSLERVTRELVWVDPNITNAENSGYVARLKATEGLFAYTTPNAYQALEALKKKKSETDYRAMTAGRGGEEFVRGVRSAGIWCRVLVFCMAVDYHQKWAAKFHNIEVTSSTSRMLDFATWKI